MPCPRWAVFVRMRCRELEAGLGLDCRFVLESDPIRCDAGRQLRSLGQN